MSSASVFLPRTAVSPIKILEGSKVRALVDCFNKAALINTVPLPVVIERAEEAKEKATLMQFRGNRLLSLSEITSQFVVPAFQGLQDKGFSGQQLRKTANTLYSASYLCGRTQFWLVLQSTGEPLLAHAALVMKDEEHATLVTINEEKKNNPNKGKVIFQEPDSNTYKQDLRMFEENQGKDKEGVVAYMQLPQLPVAFARKYAALLMENYNNMSPELKELYSGLVDVITKPEGKTNCQTFMSMNVVSTLLTLAKYDALEKAYTQWYNGLSIRGDEVLAKLHLYESANSEKVIPNIKGLDFSMLATVAPLNAEQQVMKDRYEAIEALIKAHPERIDFNFDQYKVPKLPKSVALLGWDGDFGPESAGYRALKAAPAYYGGMFGEYVKSTAIWYAQAVTSAVQSRLPRIAGT